MPDFYTNYTVHFLWMTMVTITDLNYLLTWKNAKYLETYDECNLAQRIDEMKVMANLEIVKLNIHAYAMPEMKLSPFFYNFPKKFRLVNSPKGTLSFCLVH